MFRKKSPIYHRKKGIVRQLAWGRISSTFVALCLVVGLAAVWHFTKAEQSPYVPASNQEVLDAVSHPLAAITLPADAQSAVGTLYEGVVKTNETGEPVPIASITKIITALTILEKALIEPGQQGDTITLQAKDEDYYWQYAAIGGTVTPITAGFEMTQYEILQTMLLASSNNMSDTLVDHYFASRDDYLQAAASFIQKNGLEHTTVADTTGFSPDSRSTPSDLIKLGQLALQNPVIAEIVSQKKATVSVAGEIPNYNPLIEEDLVTGIKPGFTDEAGATLLFSLDVPLPNGESKSIIAAVLNHKNDQTYFGDIAWLYAQLASSYR